MCVTHTVCYVLLVCNIFVFCIFFLFGELVWFMGYHMRCVYIICRFWTYRTGLPMNLNQSTHNTIQLVYYSVHWKAIRETWNDNNDSQLEKEKEKKWRKKKKTATKCRSQKLWLFSIVCHTSTFKFIFVWFIYSK